MHTRTPTVERRAIEWRRRARPTRRERTVAAVLGLGLAAWTVGLFVLVLLAPSAHTVNGLLGR